VRHFVGDLTLESDIRPLLERVIERMIPKLMFGNKNDAISTLSEVISYYHQMRSVGICDWNEDLDLYVNYCS
jgi:hypothetical protein